jgi:hypothetical protein
MPASLMVLDNGTDKIVDAQQVADYRADILLWRMDPRLCGKAEGIAAL